MPASSVRAARILAAVTDPHALGLSVAVLPQDPDTMAIEAATTAAR